MSERNGDNARFHRNRKKKLLRREFRLRSAPSQKAGSFSGCSSGRRNLSLAKMRSRSKADPQMKRMIYRAVSLNRPDQMRASDDRVRSIRKRVPFRCHTPSDSHRPDMLPGEPVAALFCRTGYGYWRSIPSPEGRTARDATALRLRRCCLIFRARRQGLPLGSRA